MLNSSNMIRKVTQMWVVDIPWLVVQAGLHLTCILPLVIQLNLQRLMVYATRSNFDPELECCVAADDGFSASMNRYPKYSVCRMLPIP